MDFVRKKLAPHRHSCRDMECENSPSYFAKRQEEKEDCALYNECLTATAKKGDKLVPCSTCQRYERRSDAEKEEEG